MSKVKFKPLGDVILTKVIEYRKPSKIIIIKDTTLTEKDLEVVAISDGIKKDGNLIPLSVKVGDKVMSSRTSGLTIKIDGEEYLLIREGDILGIYEE